MSEKRKSGKSLPYSRASASGKRRNDSPIRSRQRARNISNETLSVNSDDNSTRNILEMEEASSLAQGASFLKLILDFETLTSDLQNQISKLDAAIECKIDLITELENITDFIAQYIEMRLESSVLDYISVKSNIEMIKRGINKSHNVDEMIEIMESQSSQESEDAKWTLKYRDANLDSNLINLNGNNVNDAVFIKMDSFLNCALKTRDPIHLARMLMDEIFFENALRTCSLFGTNGLDKTAVVAIVNCAMSCSSLYYMWGASKKDIVEGMAKKLYYHKIKYI